jgi:thymidine kinase
MSGKITIYMGCMYSGKTSALISACRRHLSIDCKILVINYVGDNRYSEFSEIVSHNQDKISCIKVNKLENVLYEQIVNVESIMIDEGQFFVDLKEYATKWSDIYKKKIYISALDGDYKRQPFGQILELIPHAEKVHKFNALCIKCKDGTEASFTHRLSKETEQVVIGALNYVPLCRQHYLENN